MIMMNLCLNKGFCKSTMLLNAHLSCHHRHRGLLAALLTSRDSLLGFASGATAIKNSEFTYDNYQLIHESKLPTYHFQKSLLRLPIPKLEDSCQRYLDAVRAVYDADSHEVKETEELIADFLKGDGPMLQNELKIYDSKNRHSSYISEPWFDMYLTSRLPCPINYNPFMMFARDPDPAYNDQLLRATNLVISCARFKRTLEENVLEPEVFHLNPKKSDTEMFRRICGLLPPFLSWYGAAAFKAYPLDMSQYKSLFGGCRIPHRTKDKLHHKEYSRYFVVAYRGTFYSIRLFEQHGLIQPAELIFAILSQIINSEQPPCKPDECVGALTTLDRDAWADIRSELIATDPINQQSLNEIEDALFLLCLDDQTSTDPQRLMLSLLCGDDGSNRWFDKCFQLIVDANGQASINFEHSWGDGVAVLRLMEETMKDTTNHRFIHVGQNTKLKTDGFYKKLDWQLNDSLRNKIVIAQKSHITQCKKLDFGLVEHKALSKEVIKNANLSPDAIMQLAFQLAFHSIYREFVPTYESCSTAAFRKGRTECVRSATLATREAVLSFENGSMGADKLLSLVRNCSETHMKLVKEASIGQGFDRHLFGLKHTANRLGIEPSALFRHPVYERMNHFVLSTSTLSTDTIYFGGFGPVVPDGFGIGYNVTDEKLGAVTISYKDKRNAKEFSEKLELNLDKIRHVIGSS